MFNSISDNFYGTGVSPNDFSRGIVAGRLKGGVAILWKRSIDHYVEVNNFDLDWLTGISIKIGENKSILIICVYFPYQCTENEEEFLTKLGISSSTINDSAIGNIFVIEDFNANISNNSSIGG